MKDELSNLYEIMMLLKNKNDMEKFFIDLCTPYEIQSLKERWKVCQLLDKGDLSYREIRAITGASLTTIGRVARFLYQENNDGYKNVLKQIKQKRKQ